jgi:phage I-like protein
MATITTEESEVIRIVSATVALVGEQPAAEASLPERIQLLPWGWVRSSNGDFLVDREAAEAVVQRFREQGTDLVIDYDHQSLGGRYAAPNGLAPAAGWVTALKIETDVGIWGHVRWTPAAARRVLRREYRFCSPVVIVRREDRRVTALDSVALTNRPAIAGMRPVVNSQDSAPASGMCAAASDAGVVEKPAETDTFVEAGGGRARGEQANPQNTREEAMQEELKRLRLLLSMDEQAGEADVVRQACNRLAELLEQSRRREAVERVSCAMQAGKVCEAQKDWATRYALRDPAGFEEWVKEAPVVVPMQRPAPQAGEPGDGQQARRRAVIAAARGEWEANPLLQQLTGRRAYVDEALAEAGLERLAEQEQLTR